MMAILVKKRKFLLAAASVAFLVALLSAFYFLLPSKAGPPPTAAGNSAKPQEEKAKWLARISEVGAEKAYQEFKTVYAPLHFGIQHWAAHAMGEALYLSQGLPGLGVCDNTFAFGCYHSFFGAALKDKGPGVVGEFDGACISKYGPGATGCQHGIGHGLMEFYGPNQLAAALESCKKTNQQNQLFGCTSGVLMEYNFPVIVNGQETYMKPRPLNPKNPYEPCNTIVPQEFRRSCYFELPQWWDKDGVFKDDYAKIGSLCAAIEDESSESACYQGTGNVAGPSSDYRVAETIKKCDLMPNENARLICRGGASWSFFSEPKARALAPEVCDGVTEEFQERCVQESDLFGNREIFKTNQ